MQHRPPTSQVPTPSEHPRNLSTATGSLPSFNLDSQAASAEFAEQESARERSTEAEIQRLMQETRLWRIANSAQWVAWGIVQAKVPGMEEGSKRPRKSSSQERNPQNANVSADEVVAQGKDRDVEADEEEEEEEEENEEEEEEEFDYLAYAQDRALFFLGDMLQLGLVKREDLPAELWGKLKFVAY